MQPPRTRACSSDRLRPVRAAHARREGSPLAVQKRRVSAGCTQGAHSRVSPVDPFKCGDQGPCWGPALWLRGCPVGRHLTGRAVRAPLTAPASHHPRGRRCSYLVPQMGKLRLTVLSHLPKITPQLRGGETQPLQPLQAVSGREGPSRPLQGPGSWEGVGPAQGAGGRAGTERTVRGGRHHSSAQRPHQAPEDQWGQLVSGRRRVPPRHLRPSEGRENPLWDLDCWRAGRENTGLSQIFVPTEPRGPLSGALTPKGLSRPRHRLNFGDVA